MSEKENKYDEILRKLKEFTKTSTPISFQTKPQYVTAVERELEKPSLKKGEYIRVPFNLVESFSSMILYYFLVVDGILEKYKEKYVNLDVRHAHVHSVLETIGVNVIRIIKYKGEENPEELDIIHLKKSYVYILKTDLNSSIVNKDILADALFELLGEAENKFNPLIYFSSEVDKDGIFMFFRGKDTGITKDEVAISLANIPWTVDTMTVDTITVKNYPVTIYYKMKDDIAWVFIPASDIIDYVDYSFSKSFTRGNL